MNPTHPFGMTPDPDDVIVSYSVRDLLARIEKTQAEAFGRLEKGLEAKASKADVARLELRLDSHGKSIDSLEQWRHDKAITAEVHSQRDKRTLTGREKAWRVLAGIAMFLAAAAGPVAVLLTAH